MHTCFRSAVCLGCLAFFFGSAHGAVMEFQGDTGAIVTPPTPHRYRERTPPGYGRGFDGIVYAGTNQLGILETAGTDFPFFDGPGASGSNSAVTFLEDGSILLNDRGIGNGVKRRNAPVFADNFASVPEPATVLLLGTGLVALGFLRRRRAS